jgi:hypothetical protein
MARAALAAAKKLSAGDERDFHEAKLATARFYADKVLPKASWHVAAVRSGASSASNIAVEQF